MGFPDDLYKKIFNPDPPKGVTKKPNAYETSKELFVEMEAATRLGLPSLKAWGDIPWWERKLWVYFFVLKNEKERYLEKKARTEAEADAKNKRQLEEEAPRVAARVPRRLNG